jgi:hypothetical protein
MHSRVCSTGVIVTLGGLALAACSRQVDVSSGEVVATGTSASAVAGSWSAKHKETADMLIAKYGQPNVVSNEALIWTSRGPFMKTILWRNPIAHDFPMSHEDYLTQSVLYRVPADKLDELWEYDGSVWAHRTRGELSAQCDKEEMNFLALNLSHDIITNKRTVADARAFYAKTAMEFKNGNRSSPYTSGLMFSTQPSAPDRDKPHSM